jgi:branched-subunit amino acid aminotransferase/4-amino-4-deoxychorismate lyase
MHFDLRSMLPIHSIPIDDPGFLRGDSFFTTMLYEHHDIHYFQKHIDRLIYSFNLFDIPLFLADKNRLISLIPDEEPYQCARIRITVTRMHVIASITPYQRSDDPIVCIISSYLLDRTPPLSYIKHTGYQVHNLAKQEAIKTNAHDALLFNSHGCLVGSTCANAFIVKDGIWFTPPLSSGTLPGIMRSTVMAHERDITRSMLLEADEIYLTNSLIGIRQCHLNHL